MTKKALGRGLEVFLPEEIGLIKGERWAELDIDQLRPSPDQPRMKLSQKSLEELAASIKETGVIQPIVVVPEGDYYRIIVGERRWRAAQLAGLRKIPALIRQLSREKQLEISLIENLQREDLNPLEVANVYKRMVEELGLTHEEIAARVGQDRSSITNYLRLLSLPQKVQNFLAEEKISMGHARALAALTDSALQISLAEMIVKRGLSVRETEKLVKKWTQGRGTAKVKKVNPELLAMEEALIRFFGTKVKIEGSPKKGIIKIFYYSSEDLTRLSQQLCPRGER
ncbi:MAG: ParB/RepB/Spo0J family partition protein [Candidatus Aminicenantes bacterium]|nr:ParB/RepB/Spo0J family partition protein [Candidatus Aminicenantes bacterium]